MAPSFEDFIQSQQFTFFVGQEKKPIVVHAAAIAAASEQLDALINGMKGLEMQCVRLEGVRVDDFIRFCEYAYRGDYTVPPWEDLPPEELAPEELAPEEPAPEEPAPEEPAPEEPALEETPPPTSGKNQQNGDDDDWGNFAPSYKKNFKKKKKGNKCAYKTYPLSESEPEPIYEVQPVSRAPLRTQFNSRNYLNDSTPRALILQHFEPKPNSAVEQNFTPVLLAHARLYCFARLRLIAPLQALTLDKLHRTLMEFRLYTKRVGDIIELARYAYSSPDLPDRSDDGTLNDLKTLVVEYIVCEIDTIGKCDEFVKYMEEGGEFVGDFWRKAREYMV